MKDSKATVFDKALGDHYKQCGRDDYYDKYGYSILIRFMHENEFQEEHLEEQFGKKAKLDHCDFIDMDNNFPLLTSKSDNIPNKTSKHKEIFEVLQHCYQFGLSPITHGQLLHQGSELHGFQRIDRALMLYYENCGAKIIIV